MFSKKSKVIKKINSKLNILTKDKHMAIENTVDSVKVSNPDQWNSLSIEDISITILLALLNSGVLSLDDVLESEMDEILGENAENERRKERVDRYYNDNKSISNIKKEIVGESKSNQSNALDGKELHNKVLSIARIANCLLESTEFNKRREKINELLVKSMMIINTDNPIKFKNHSEEELAKNIVISLLEDGSLNQSEIKSNFKYERTINSTQPELNTVSKEEIDDKIDYIIEHIETTLIPELSDSLFKKIEGYLYKISKEYPIKFKDFDSDFLYNFILSKLLKEDLLKLDDIFDYNHNDILKINHNYTFRRLIMNNIYNEIQCRDAVFRRELENKRKKFPYHAMLGDEKGVEILNRFSQNEINEDEAIDLITKDMEVYYGKDYPLK